MTLAIIEQPKQPSLEIVTRREAAYRARSRNLMMTIIMKLKKSRYVKDKRFDMIFTADDIMKSLVNGKDVLLTYPSDDGYFSRALFEFLPNTHEIVQSRVEGHIWNDGPQFSQRWTHKSKVSNVDYWRNEITFLLDGCHQPAIVNADVTLETFFQATA